MKKLACLLLAMLTLGVGAAVAETTEVVVFAAASMTETLGQIKALYEAAHPDDVHHLQFRFLRHTQNPDSGGRFL